MSGDERLVLILSVLASLWLWGGWLYRATRPPAIICPSPARWPLLLMPPGCACILLAILLSLAADDVRDSAGYVFMYLAMGSAWVGIVVRISGMFAISARQDVLERRNAAAGWALAGVLVGVTLSFAGGNIGNGPGWWVVVFSAGLATLALLAMWVVLQWVAGITDLVIIQRDYAAGIRLGAMLAAGGLILGRSVAGDWESMEQTIRDFFDLGWPVTILAALEIIMSWAARPTRYHPAAPILFAGVLPGLAYLLLALLYLSVVGWWP